LLPFLNKAKMQTGVMVKTRQPDESSEENKEESSDLESMVKEAIEHYKANDFKQLASFIKSIIDHCQDEPKEEQNESAPHSYDASKEE